MPVCNIPTQRNTKYEYLLEIIKLKKMFRLIDKYKKKLTVPRSQKMSKRAEPYAQGGGLQPCSNLHQQSTIKYWFRTTYRYTIRPTPQLNAQ